MKTLYIVAGIMMLAGTLQANQVVSLDFQPGGDGNTYASNYTGVAAAADTGTVWNIVAPAVGAGAGDESGGWYGGAYSQSNLVDSTGADAGMTFSFSDGVFIAISDSHGGYGDIPTNATGLMRDYIQMDASGWSRSVFLEGLATNQAYELYLYGSGPWNRDTFFAVRVDDDTTMDWGGAQWVGSATTDPGTVSDPHALTEGADYVKFTFTTAANMDTLWVEYRGDGDGDDIAPFNGLQLVALEAEPVPPVFGTEPPAYQVVTVGNELTFGVTASNSVDDIITLSASGLPDGATFPTDIATNDIASSTFTWTPSAVGVYTVTFSAAGNDGTPTASTTIYVENEGLSAAVASMNVDFQPDNTNGLGYAVDYSGAGAYDDGDNGWNIAGPVQNDVGADDSGGWFSGGYTFSNLVDSTGAGTGMNLFTQEGDIVAFNTNHVSYADFATNAAGLMSDYIRIEANGWERSVFVEGLVPGRTYELYLYGASQWDRDTTFRVRCDTDMNKNWGSEQYVGEKTTDALTGAHSLTEGADYVRFSFTTDADMDTLWIDYTGDGDGDNFASFNGLQLVTVGTPEFLPIADQTITLGSNVTFDVTATNGLVEGDVIILSATSLPDAAATFATVTNATSATSTFSWTPAVAGSYTATFAAEGSNGAASASVTITVQAPDVSPVSVMNVDFQSGPGLSNINYSVTYSGQGALSDAGNDTWNAVAPTLTTNLKGDEYESGGSYTNGYVVSGLVSSDGTDAGMTLSLGLEGDAYAHSSSNGAYASFATNAVDLMSDYLYWGAAEARSVFVEGLIPGATYKLYLYGAGQWSRSATFAVRCDDDASGTYEGAQYIGNASTSATEDGHALAEGTDYVVFTFIADAGMDTLWIEYEGSDSVFNGLQLATLVEAAGPTESPTVISSVADGSLVMSWTDGFSYNILTNNDLTNPDGWGVATSGTSPITNVIGDEAALFFKLEYQE